MGRVRPASATSEAIEAEVSLKVWYVLHGTLRWASEADGPCEAGLCNLRGRGLTEGLGRFASQSGCGGGVASAASLPPEASQ